MRYSTWQLKVTTAILDSQPRQSGASCRRLETVYLFFYILLTVHHVMILGK